MERDDLERRAHALDGDWFLYFQAKWWWKLLDLDCSGSPGILEVWKDYVNGNIAVNFYLIRK